MSTNLRRIQAKVKEATRRLKLANSPELCGLDFSSEAGEVAKEILELTDYGKREYIYNPDLARELGDAFYSLIALANIYDIDLERELIASLQKYEKREKRRSNLAESKVKLEPITLSKSFLVLTSIAGCRNDCVYCYKHGWDIKNKFKPERLFETKDILNDLKEHKYFNPNIPLAINNSAADPFQEGVTETTFELLDGLESMRLKNIVALITKEYLSEEMIGRLESYKHIRPIIFVSYAFLPQKFEKVVNDRRMESIRNISRSKLKKVLYYRPIISGVNDSEKIASEIVKLGETYFDCIVRSSLKADVNTIEYMAKKGIFLDPRQDIGLNIHDSLKKMLPETRERVDGVLAKSSIPYFKKTSCAISYLFNEPDYNTHWIRKEIYCSRNCPEAQQSRCLMQSTKKPSDKEVKRLLKRLKLKVRYKTHKDRITIESSNVFYSDVKFLRKALKFPVLISVDNEELTAEEYDRKFVNADRNEIRKLIKKKGIPNYTKNMRD